jgi:hemerythrin-like domain-containing protein
MRAIIQSLRRDHSEIEQVLRVLEQECDRFRRAERPDYDLLREVIDYFQSFLDQHHHPKKEFMLNLLARTRSVTCARILDGIAGERAIAASSLQQLAGALGEILNEQRVLRQVFDDAACRFIQHERRQIEIEERQLFPEALSVLTPADWADIHARLREEKASPRAHQLQEQLRAQRGWIVREALAKRNEAGEERLSANEG